MVTTRTYSIKLSAILRRAPKIAYRAITDPRKIKVWSGNPGYVNTDKHVFDFYNGWVFGRVLDHDVGKSLYLEWKTKEWERRWCNSIAELKLLPSKRGSKLLIYHKMLPTALQARWHEDAWRKYFIIPLQRYLSPIKRQNLGFCVSTIVRGNPKDVFEVLTDACEIESWSASTGFVDGKTKKFEMFDDWVKGKVLSFKPGKHYSVTWRGADWEKDWKDSRVRVSLKRVRQGTKITVCHRNLPNMQQVKWHKSGWREYVFIPVQKYFIVPTDERYSWARDFKKKKRRYA